ncbi:MAG: hypothetical protein KatS3mg112_1022 [Thermogutta sp.]|nr:MAG: hypothetical protein KatS3mg112_1022 [Thermogutta sp.]
MARVKPGAPIPRMVPTQPGRAVSVEPRSTGGIPSTASIELTRASVDVRAPHRQRKSGDVSTGNRVPRNVPSYGRPAFLTNPRHGRAFTPRPYVKFVVIGP